MSAAAAPFADVELAPEAGVGRSSQRVLRTALHTWRCKIGLGLLALIAALALFGPLLAPHGPQELLSTPNGPPGDGLALGADALGRDVLARLLHGGRTILWTAIAATTLGTLLGLAVGLFAAYDRGRLDGLLMRGMDVLLAIPHIVLVLVILSVTGPSTTVIVLLVAVAYMPSIARVVRGSSLQVVNREFIEAAEALGVRRRRILWRELLPNVTTPLMVEYGLRLTWAIGLIAGINFLGLGAQPPAADWGLMINENRGALTTQPWGVLAPVICIALFAIGSNLVTEGIARAVSGVDRKGSA